MLASVEAIDKDARRVRLDDGSTVDFDTLVLATGARHAYFGHDDWEPFAPGLKTLEDATAIRGRILLAFERAEREADEHKLAALMTFVIVGAGPTGVELAGTIAELRGPPCRRTSATSTQKGADRADRGGTARASRLEGGSVDYAKRSLERLGVEVELARRSPNARRRRRLRRQDPGAATVIWAAGVQASPAAQWLDAPADRVGR